MLQFSSPPGASLMRKISVIYIFGLFLLSSGACGEVVVPEPTQTVRDFLGASIITTTLNPTATRSYEVAGEKTDGGELAGHEIVAGGPALDEDEVRLFQSIVLDEKSYIWGETKKCPFLPEYAIEFEGESGRFLAFISFSCNQIKFVEGDLERLQDVDPARRRLRQLVRKIF